MKNNATNNKLWKIYFYFLCGCTIILILIVPIFNKRDVIFGNFIFDLLGRVFITYCLYLSINTAIYTDDTYEKFYKGANNVSLDLQNRFNRTLFILIAIGNGIGVYFIYTLAFTLFGPFYSGSKFIIATIFTVLIEIPFIYRLYNGPIRNRENNL